MAAILHLIGDESNGHAQGQPTSKPINIEGNEDFESEGAFNQLNQMGLGGESKPIQLRYRARRAADS